MSAQEAEKSLQASSLLFVPNRGQQPDQVAFTALGANPSMFFTGQGITYSLLEHVKADLRDAATRLPKDFAERAPRKGWAVRQDFIGARPLIPIGTGLTPGKVNYLIGPISEHVTNLPTYSALTYPGLWDGVDLHYRGEDGALKYEFHVRPGADPSQVRLAYRGAKNVSLTSAGELLIKTPVGSFTDAAPVAWQDVAGQRVSVTVSYLPAPAHDKDGFVYGFSVGSYDAALPLVIDPAVLVYSTFLGGGGGDAGSEIAIDGAGAAYATGGTQSGDFPTTLGAFDTTFNDNDAFVTKLGPTEAAPLSYSTFLGGGGGDGASGIAVDGAGAAYVTGRTDSVDFPTTAGAFDETFSGGGQFNGGDAFVTKLGPTGAAPLSYSTYLGGGEHDTASGIAIDGAGGAYVTGSTQSGDFPTTGGAFDPSLGGTFDAFVTKLDPSGTAPLSYSTFLGGGDFDLGIGIAVDGAGTAYVTGDTQSEDFPTTAGAFDTSFNSGEFDAFVTKLGPTGAAPLSYSTFLGGGGSDAGFGIAVDGAGAAYVTGDTGSGDFPTTAGAFDTSLGGFNDAFVAKLGPTGAAPLSYATFLGGGGPDTGLGIAVDGAGAAYVTGRTQSGDFPTTDGADPSLGGFDDAFVSKLGPTGAAPLSYSTYLGGGGGDAGVGIAVDCVGTAYVTGGTGSGDFPTTAGAFDTSLGGGGDAFVTKLDPTETEPDTVPPSLTLTQPEEGHLYLEAAGIDMAMPLVAQVIIVTPLSSYELQATATDNIGVATVRFSVDGSVVCTDATAPYACDWSPGSALLATVRAVALDSSCNESPPDEVEVLLGV